MAPRSSTTASALSIATSAVSTLDWWYGMYKVRRSPRYPADVGAGWSGEAFAKQRVASRGPGRLDDPVPGRPQGRLSASSITRRRCPSARPAARPTCCSSTPGAHRPRPSSLRPLRRWLSSWPAGRTRALSCRPASRFRPSRASTTIRYFQGSGVENQISKTIYQTGTYGTPITTAVPTIPRSRRR